MDKYNPIQSEKDIELLEFKVKNMTIYDKIKRTQAAQYWAEKWYYILDDMTPESYIFEITDEDIECLMKGELSESLEINLQKGLNNGYHFIRSTAKSSHSRKKVMNLTDCLEELTNACLIMSYKYMCRHIFMRKYVNINQEYRCYVYKGKLRYIEEYYNQKVDENIDHHNVKKSIELYVDQVTNKLKFVIGIPV